MMKNIDYLIVRLEATTGEALPSEAAAALREQRDDIARLTDERKDWARRFKLNDLTPWEWMTRSEKAEAEIERLTKERDHWREARRGALAAGDILRDRAEKAEAERDAAIRDAERYRWVRTLANMDYPVRHGAPGISINMPTGNNACHYPVQSDLDAAIDAARKA